MAISGPSLEELRRKVHGLASRGFRQDVLKVLSEEARKLVVDEFQGSHDPEGAPWLPLKRRQGLPLLNHGILRNSVKFRPTATGVEGTSNLVYAAIHNFGGQAGRGLKVTIPRRAFFPQGSLGPVWGAAFERVINEMVRRRAA